MFDALTKDGLGPNHRRLVDLMEETDYGSILNLVVRGGQPRFDPPPRILRTIKLKAGSDRQGRRTQIEIKDQTLELIRHLRQLGDGTVELIEVQAGLPYRIVIEQPQ